MLHAVLLLLWREASRLPLAQPSSSVAALLDLTLMPQKVETSAAPTEPQDKASSKTTRPLPDALKQSSPTDGVVDNAALFSSPEIVTSAKSAPPFVPVEHRGGTLAGELIANIRNIRADALADRFEGVACTPAERHSGLRNCAPSFAGSIDQRSAFYTQLFKQGFSHIWLENPSFLKDMALVDDLIAQADQLAAVDPTDEVQAALIRERQYQLQQDVLSIDRRYAQFNLLRLIPIGMKTFKGLRKMSADR